LLELRPYQKAAIDAVYSHLRSRDDNPCIVIPTAGGKTPVMAVICRDTVAWGGRILILAHVKELLEQTRDHILSVAPDLALNVGVYSAGLKSRDTSTKILVAGIQSVYKRAEELGPFDIVMVDEAHTIPVDGEGMYLSFLHDIEKVNPNVRVIGLTATPFRTKEGMVCSPVNILNHICFGVGVKELIVQGYICPLISVAGAKLADTSTLHVRAGEFMADEVEDLMDEDGLVNSACAEIIEATEDRKAVLIFASGVKHGKHIAELIPGAATIFGDTPSDERANTIARFKAGEIKYLVNMGVLTQGFDAPTIDCVALLRPTLSPGLFYQMVGRGFRLSPGKTNCLVLDFGGNVLRHGPVDELRIDRRQRPAGAGQAPAKQCPECRALVSTGYSVCPICGFIFPPPEKARHDGKASLDGILSGQTTTEAFPVQHVYYRVHTKMGAPEDDPKTMRVEYVLGLNHFVSEWICFEHTGWARQKAKQWWLQRRCEGATYTPATSKEAVELAEAGELCETKSIVVKTTAGERYQTVAGYELENDLPKKEEAYEDIPW
jgi:DNA repair protein RadD